MNQFLRDNAPALLLVLASVILTVTFSLPVGIERRLFGTQYQRLEGFVGGFQAREAAAGNSLKAGSQGNDELGMIAQAVRQQFTPVLANALLRRVESLTREPAEKTLSRQARGLKGKKQAASGAAVATNSVPVKQEERAVVLTLFPVTETADSVEETYENNPAKYSLDASAAQGTVVLHLRGISRSGVRYIVKVAVTNRGSEDFFVKEFSVRQGRETLDSKSHIRLFVEPGRTREGFVVFPKPRSGADVHIALKEDREKGRVIQLPVPYPF